ncbi:hypothetical protein M8C21_020773 [Ambrosia artemisiifolia]|uniref:Uncharacterized protein n=1 Tax=Ambrosia artemisiifolia TaxID=4212 RepID=A0AAD5G6W5_AMBAR|nr:hypothetical protein M8C21_020773 [Ambrosia artemisiifolia]
MQDTGVGDDPPSRVVHDVYSGVRARPAGDNAATGETEGSWLFTKFTPTGAQCCLGEATADLSIGVKKTTVASDLPVRTAVFAHVQLAITQEGSWLFTKFAPTGAQCCLGEATTDLSIGVEKTTVASDLPVLWCWQFGAANAPTGAQGGVGKCATMEGSRRASKADEVSYDSKDTSNPQSLIKFGDGDGYSIDSPGRLPPILAFSNRNLLQILMKRIFMTRMMNRTLAQMKLKMRIERNECVQGCLPSLSIDRLDSLVVGPEHGFWKDIVRVFLFSRHGPVWRKPTVIKGQVPDDSSHIQPFGNSSDRISGSNCVASSYQGFIRSQTAAAMLASCGETKLSPPNCEARWLNMLGLSGWLYSDY